MSNVTKKLFCYGCDLDFTVKFSEDNTKFSVEYCPFCGESIDQDDGDEESEDEETNDDTDRWG